MQLFKNVASQKIRVFAFADAGHATLDPGEPVTGDQSNITARTAVDDGTLAAPTTATVTQIDATNAPGYYEFGLSQAETNGDLLEFYAISSTAGVQVVTVGGAVQMTAPPNLPDLGIESDGDLSVVNTLTGHTAQTGDSFARIGAPAGASVSADIAAIEGQTDDIGVAGAGLTAVPWNAAWDAEVQSEVNDALVALGLDHLVSAAVIGTDVTDNSIVARLVSSSATADWDSYVNTTDSMQAIRDHVGDGTNLTEAGGTGDHLTAVTVATNNDKTGYSISGTKTTLDALNDITTAQVNTEVDTGLADIHLDHLLAVDYDPATPPGVATALLNELVESDGGVSRFTANTLEQAPSAGTNPNVLADTTVTGLSSQTVFNLTAGSNDDDAYNGQAIVLYDASDSDFPSVRVVSDYVGSTRTVTLDSAPDFTLANSDGVKIFVTAPGTSAPTAGQVADAVWDEPRSGHVTAGTFGEGVLTESLNTQAKADVNAEADTALTDYDAPTNTEMVAAFTEIKGATWATTDTLEAIRDRGDAAWVTATGFATSAALATVDTNVDTLVTNVGTPPNLGSGATLAANNTDLAGATFSTATDSQEAIRNQGDAAWITAVGFSTLDAAGVRSAVGLAAANLDTQLSNIQSDTNDLQARTPAALVGGRVDANVGAISGATTGVAGFERATTGITTGTCDTGGSTTSVVTSTLSPAASVIDQFKGLILKFDSDTSTAALRGQATDITSNTAAGVLTVTALTTAPASGDTFTIS